MWERWDSLLPDGSVNPGEMTSFNHYAFGCVGEWMHTVVGGLARPSPATADLRIAPVPGHGVNAATATLRTPYGPAACDWTLDGHHDHPRRRRPAQHVSDHRAPRPARPGRCRLRPPRVDLRRRRRSRHRLARRSWNPARDRPELLPV